MRHQSNPNLPKLEFYDTGNLKMVETTEKFNGGLTETDLTVLDKTTGKIKSEYVTTVVDDKSRNEFSTRLEIKERDARGNLTYSYETAVRLNGTYMTANSEEDRYTYDATTGKQISHDETTSWGRKVHEEFNPQTGKENSPSSKSLRPTHVVPTTKRPVEFSKKTSSTLIKRKKPSSTIQTPQDLQRKALGQQWRQRHPQLELQPSHRRNGLQ